jgi:hypothetical protein
VQIDVPQFLQDLAARAPGPAEIVSVADGRYTDLSLALAARSNITSGAGPATTLFDRAIGEHVVVTSGGADGPGPEFH